MKHVQGNMLENAVLLPKCFIVFPSLTAKSRNWSELIVKEDGWVPLILILKGEHGRNESTWTWSSGLSYEGAEHRAS